jgi:hypothetical protein
MIGLDLPSFRGRQPLVWQRSLAEATVDATYSAVLIGHVGGSGFDGASINCSHDRSLLALRVDDVVQCAHDRETALVCSLCLCGL